MNLSRLFAAGLFLVFLSGILISGFSSCKHNDDITGLDTICFQTEILPIFEINCTYSGCHTSSGGDESIDLSYYNGIMKGVTPGNAMKSKVYTVLSNVWSDEEMMPPDRPLSIENRTKIKLWIEQEAKETKCP